MRTTEYQDIQQLRSEPPWLLMLLLKWVLAHADFGPARPGPLPRRDYARLINLMHEVDRSVRLPTEHEDVALFFRSLAYQQFWYQRQVNRGPIGRQLLLFRGLPAGHRFRGWFHGETGLDLETWVDLAFATVAWFLQKPRPPEIRLDTFATLHGTFAPADIKSFLDDLTLELEEAALFASGHDPGPERTPDEFRERTPFVRHPFIKINNGYMCYGLRILLAAIETHVYDRLRGHAPGDFGVIFGPIFEQYVRHALDHARVDYLDEAELKRRFGKGKVVDFLVEDATSRVYLDAKGVELTHKGMTTHRADILSGSLKASVLKGIAQAHSLSQRIVDTTKTTKENFLVVITFNEMYLGDGEELQRCTPDDRWLRTRVDGLTDAATIPPRNMLFLSAEEWDFLVGAIVHDGANLVDVLRNAARMNEDHATRRFVLSQHILDRYGRVRVPAYIEDAFVLMSRRVSDAIDESAP